MMTGRPSYSGNRQGAASTLGMPMAAPKVTPPPAYNQAWKDNLKRLHSEFTFDQPTDLLSMKVEEPKVKRQRVISSVCDKEEIRDPIEDLIRRIMYAEGDFPQPMQDESSAAELRTLLPVIVAKLCPSHQTGDESNKVGNVLDMGLVRHVFSDQLRWFYKTKNLTKSLKQPGGEANKDGQDDEDVFKDGDSDELEESEDEDCVRGEATLKDDEDEAALFTKDHLGKLADKVTRKPAENNCKDGETGEERKESHFKSFLRDLEENVSSDEEED